jgi:beta propeller repeat protein
MTPQPGKKSLASEAVFIGGLLVLLLIMGACGFVIYDYITPDSSPTPMPTLKPTLTATPTTAPTEHPTPTPTATVKPTLDPGYYQQDSRVTMGDFEYYYPAVWDHYIVYDMFDGVKNYTQLYDINTRERTQIADGWVFSYGTISNGKVMLFYPKGNKIYLYDIKTRESALTCTDDNNARGSITMYGSKLAYYQDVGHRNSDGSWAADYHIYVFSMEDGYAADVMDKIPKPLDIRIYGDRLVYTVVNGGGSDIYLLDLATKNWAPKKISTGTGNNNHARIYDHNIVYHSDAEGADHIYIYDINTGTTISPTTEGRQWNADIYGDTIVYDSYLDDNWDIYAFDLNTHVERRITNEPNDQRAPVIYGSRIAYMDNRDGYAAIYTLSIE